MDNKEKNKISDDYIDSIIDEIESTGDVLDDPVSESEASAASEPVKGPGLTPENGGYTEPDTVGGKIKERIGDITTEIKEQYREIFSDYEAERKQRKRERRLEFYGGEPPKDRKAREMYIALYTVRKFFSVIGTAIFTLFLMFALTGTMVGTVVAVYLLNFMDTTDSVVLSDFQQSFASYVYEMNKETDEYELIYKVTPSSHVVKLPCNVAELPDHVKFAFVSIEDERFYSHEGVDYKRTAAAIINLALNQIGVQRDEFGGSTITQQLIKNVTGDDEQTWDRKMREIFKAMKFEKNYTKDDILEAYLDEIYFSAMDGYHMYGIEAAAIGYFGKSAKELTIAEAACLAAIPKAPNDYNPDADYEANKERKETCLYKMFELGVISAEEYEDAMSEEILITSMPQFKKLHPAYKQLTENEDDFENPAVLSWPLETAIAEISDWLKDKYDLESREDGYEKFKAGGYKLYLTTDRDVQEHLDGKYDDWYWWFPQSTSTADQMVQSAIAVLDYNGHVLGLEGKIGEKKAEENLGWNIAYEGGRQPGSTIKPVTTYGYAIETGLMYYSSYYYDSYLPYGVVPGFEYWPNNYDGAPTNALQPVWYFLKNSINTLPAQIVYNNGDNLAQEVFDFATKRLHLDLNPELDVDFAPLCIGATSTGPSVINLANAYMPYGNEGKYYKASIIGKCVDVMTGDVVIDNITREPEQAVSPETANIMTKLMEKVITDGTGTAARLWSAPLVGKTGTSEDWRDISFVGLTPDYVSAVWVGYDKGTNEWAIEAANSAEIWYYTFGTYADENWSGNDFPECDTVSYESYCAYTGSRATSRCPGGGMGYFKAEDPYCSYH